MYKNCIHRKKGVDFRFIYKSITKNKWNSPLFSMTDFIANKSNNYKNSNV